MLKKMNLKSMSAGLLMLVIMLASCNNPVAKETASNTTDSLGSNDGFVQIFDGKTFINWDGDTSYWHIEDGVLTGLETPDRPLTTNSFMIYRGGEPTDFEFKAEYRISPEGNSGVQYRSEELKDIKYSLKGYQADIDGADV